MLVYLNKGIEIMSQQAHRLLRVWWPKPGEEAEVGTPEPGLLAGIIAALIVTATYGCTQIEFLSCLHEIEEAVESLRRANS